MPQRWLAFAGLLAVGATTIAGLEAAYARMLDRVAAGGAPVAAFAIDAKGSLACWFSSLLLLAAAVGAILVYTVRRHRADDYRGRYRVWFWAACCLFLMATDQAASLREGFRDLMIWLTGTTLMATAACGGSRSTDLSGSRWIAAGGRHAAEPAFDDRPICRRNRSRPGLGRPAGLCLRRGRAAGGDVPGGSEMAGDLLLLAAMLLHARYVLLDAQGLLPCRQQAAEEPEKATLQVGNRAKTSSEALTYGEGLTC